jgi:hypothetical protein
MIPVCAIDRKLPQPQYVIDTCRNSFLLAHKQRLEKGGYSKGNNPQMEEMFEVFPPALQNPRSDGEAPPFG